MVELHHHLILTGMVYYTAPAYTYAWSNGATTANVSNLGMGPIAVTVTDCNGCTGSLEWIRCC